MMAPTSCGDTTDGHERRGVQGGGRYSAAIRQEDRNYTALT